MKTKLLILLLLISILSFGQTNQQKIEFILKTNGSVEGYKSFLMSLLINPIKNSVDKSDSLKLSAIENKLTDAEVLKRLSSAFSEVFNDKEVDDIYSFYNTSAGKKMISSRGFLQKKFTSAFTDINTEIETIAQKYSRHDEAKKVITKKVNTEDGIYNVLNDESELMNLKLSPKPAVKKSEIKDAKVLKDALGRNVIDLTLTKEGAEKFRILTANNIGRPVAIVLNNMLISAPQVASEIPNGKIQISGSFSEKEAQEIVNAIK